MRIYTKTGDSGTTGLIGGSREAKSHEVFHAIGDLDEANGAIGVCASVIKSTWPERKEFLDLALMLELAQQRIFEIGSELASPTTGSLQYRLLPDSAACSLEESIDAMNEALPPLANFILPGGSVIASQLHLARSVVRRAERSIVALDQTSSISANIKSYVNRLSDWLFMSARYANYLDSEPETTWGGKS